jgi:hypothetical protein
VSAPTEPRLTPAEQLAADRRFERVIAWRGLVALTVVAAIVLARAWWWV